MNSNLKRVERITSSTKRLAITASLVPPAVFASCLALWIASSMRLFEDIPVVSQVPFFEVYGAYCLFRGVLAILNIAYHPKLGVLGIELDRVGRVSRRHLLAYLIAAVVAWIGLTLGAANFGRSSPLVLVAGLVVGFFTIGLRVVLGPWDSVEEDDPTRARRWASLVTGTLFDLLTVVYPCWAVLNSGEFYADDYGLLLHLAAGAVEFFWILLPGLRVGLEHWRFCLFSLVRRQRWT